MCVRRLSNGQRHGARRRQQQQQQQVQGLEQEAAEYKGVFGMENGHVVYGIMAANVAVFLGWHASDDVSFMKQHFTLSMDNIRAGRVHTVITSMFSHSEMNRLIFSTVALFLIGRPVVSTIGQGRLLALYLSGGTATALAGLAVASQSDQARRAPPMTWRFGSNGAVLALAGFGAGLAPTMPLAGSLAVVAAAALPVGVFALAGMHSEGDYAHLLGAAFGLGVFLATRRLHPAWAASVPKYHSR